MAPKYTLHYFNSKGRAETIRWLFAVARVEYEDKRYTQEEWAEFKPKTPFEQLPVLEFEDGEMMPQTGAIMFYLASEFGMLGDSKREAGQIAATMDCLQDTCVPLIDMFFGATDEIKKTAAEKFTTVTLPKFLKFVAAKLKDGKQYVVGEKISVVDLAIARVSADMPADIKTIFAKFPEVQALVDRVLAVPELKEWIEKRPKTDM